MHTQDTENPHQQNKPAGATYKKPTMVHPTIPQHTRKRPPPNTKQYTPYALAHKLPPTTQEETPPKDTENPCLLDQHKEQTGLIPINKESKIYYGTYKPRQRWDTTTTPSNTPQTRAPSPTKTPDQGLPNNYSPKMDKTKTPKQVPNHHTTKEKPRKGAPPRPRQPPHPLYRTPRFLPSNPPPFLAPPLASPVSLFPRICF